MKDKIIKMEIVQPGSSHGRNTWWADIIALTQNGRVLHYDFAKKQWTDITPTNLLAFNGSSIKEKK